MEAPITTTGICCLSSKCSHRLPGAASPLFTTGFLDPQYRRFITRRLREVWGFEGTPINVNMRVRERRKR